MGESSDVRRCSLADDCTMHPSGIRTMRRNRYVGVTTRVTHAIACPAGCCPVSHNPREGSTLTVSYTPASAVLEVYGLSSYLRAFVGGHPSGERNMEGMIDKLARDAADALDVAVVVRAELVLDTGRMVVDSFADPPGIGALANHACPSPSAIAAIAAGDIEGEGARC
jgi:hypothetical protein